jgi:prophage antirepressor-like protein
MLTLPDFHSITLTAIERDGEPWIAAPDLARALGYARPNAVAQIFDRNHTEFAENMSAVIRLDQDGSQPQFEAVTPRSKQSDTRIFSLRGAHLVAMFAKTPNAAAFRRWVLDILDARTRPTGDHRGDPGELRRQMRLWLDTQDHVTIAPLLDFLSFEHDEETRRWAANLLREAGWRREWVRGPRAAATPMPRIVGPAR